MKYKQLLNYAKVGPGIGTVVNGASNVNGLPLGSRVQRTEEAEVVNVQSSVSPSWTSITEEGKIVAVTDDEGKQR
jgi:hypothetical protein